MTLRQQVWFWVATFIGLVLFLLVFSSILLPFVAGMALAYLLDPVADFFERHGFGRLLATLIILVLFVVVFISVLLIIGPLVGSQIAGFLEELPRIVTGLEALITDHIGPWLHDKGLISQAQVQSSLGDIMGKAASWLATVLQSVWSGGQALLSIISLLVVTPVVAFYLLLDWDDMIARIDSWLPRAHQQTIRELCGQMDAAVAGFVRGQVLVCLILGTFYAVGLLLVGLKFGLLIGLTAGLVSFIPYVGALAGFLMSIGVALFQFWPDPLMIGAVLLVFATGQFLEGNILQPKLVGHSVGLHPVWLMFALFAFGSLMGFVGMLIAIPAAAAVGVLARFGLRQYLSSPFYAAAPKATNKLEELE
ncbi:AI-2E family transporter [Pseudovibrio exalbescens]|uniref:AI-2E family transporter n=1 Tax=Pseudovibrio exalbescens TaxID=197461 RepID=A0A1U7JE57_9HYPH|nr:AI-2E family transporter [Pseudovibrio exalbescens]OKL42974.1 AI-2E family transporter [Pseudovibrio exalbescens]